MAEEKVVLCATKDMKLWHITPDKKQTLCGERDDLSFFTDPVDIPMDLKYMCQKCLK